MAEILTGFDDSKIKTSGYALLDYVGWMQLSDLVKKSKSECKSLTLCAVLRITH
jgi:hypothetical protein